MRMADRPKQNGHKKAQESQDSRRQKSFDGMAKMKRDEENGTLFDIVVHPVHPVKTLLPSAIAAVFFCGFCAISWPFFFAGVRRD
ncbi:MAG: hypothetical protein FJ304_04910 [Planctomycetes bacterium]|nr:hypothetical protein [Planctomycetota bacterium]